MPIYFYFFLELLCCLLCDGCGACFTLVKLRCVVGESVIWGT